MVHINNGVGIFLEKVGANDVIDFLTQYKTHPEAYKVQSQLLAEFIELMVSRGQFDPAGQLR